ncbi:MAG: hypothetical protein ACYSYM_07210, partial [Planctomycetota bacterium]
RLRCSAVNIQGIGGIDLRKYNVLILPHSGDLAPVLGKKGIEKIKRWVEGGGTLIAVGSSAAFAAGKDQGLSSVRLKRDVLDKLVEYQEAVEREKKARHIEFDPGQIWGTTASQESQGGCRKTKAHRRMAPHFQPDGDVSHRHGQHGTLARVRLAEKAAGDVPGQQRVHVKASGADPGTSCGCRRVAP